MSEETPEQGHDPLHRHPGRDVARAIGDPGRLLHGEDPSSREVDDAQHWEAVYEELLTFKEEILTATRRRLEAVTESAREELLGIDIPVLEAERDRLQARRDFWRARRRDLGD